MIESGTSRPFSMYDLASLPTSLCSLTASRSISPVETCGFPVISDIRPDCVPFPAPGGPNNIIDSPRPQDSISLPPGEYGGPYIEQLFTNCLNSEQHPYFAEICHLEVSSHLLIARDGKLIQFVPFDRRAWHAGKSCYQGRDNCNDFSIGIELEGTDTSGYEPIQYEMLKDVVETLIAYYPGLSRETITGHQDIAPERKTDPGPGFDWAYLKQLLA